MNFLCKRHTNYQYRYLYTYIYTYMYMIMIIRSECYFKTYMVCVRVVAEQETPGSRAGGTFQTALHHRRVLSGDHHEPDRPTKG